MLIIPNLNSFDKVCFPHMKHLHLINKTPSPDEPTPEEISGWTISMFVIYNGVDSVKERKKLLHCFFL